MIRRVKPSTASRRRFLQTSLTAGALGAAATAPLTHATHAAEPGPAATRRRIRQSACHWCFNPLSVDDLARACRELGLESVELVGPEQFPTLKKHQLTCAIFGRHGFAKGFAHLEEHAECVEACTRALDEAAEFGAPNVITFSGFRRGLSLEEGRRNMIDGLKKLAAHAERRKVNLCLEMLNSRVDVSMKGHPDYFCDDIDLSVEIVKAVASERVKVLFDIYHVQIMHGDVITRIKAHAPWIGHVHTAGVPGRQDLDDQQELNYPAILRALLDTGYRGWVGQEFIPKGADKVQALAQAVRLCDV
ncbi:MAG: TIM barrel protein [Verrucomicrobiales bacterium]|nr:TIM barrel protein [Verrucomicrobiales bacterium]